MVQKIKNLYHSAASNDRFTAFLCYLLPFLGLGGYLAGLIANNSILHAHGYYLIHYLYTYERGFVARGLVGEVISWFYDTVTDDVTRMVVTLFSALLMISAALCIGKALNKVKNKPKLLFIVAMLCILICFLPGSIRDYYKDIKLDKLFWALTLFSVLLVDKKHGILLVPVLCVIATLVNPIFLFCSMILISIILLQEFHSKNYSPKSGALCAVSYISMIVLGVYALASEKYLGFETPQELTDYYFARYAGELDSETYRLFVTEWLFDYFDTMSVIIRKSFQIYFVEWQNWKICLGDLIFLMIPTYTILGIFWKSCMKDSENKFQKFIFFLCMISPVVIILPVAFSWETSKYFYNNLIVQLALIIYYIVSGNVHVLNAVEKTTNKMKQNPVLSISLATYFLSFVCFYIT